MLNEHWPIGDRASYVHTCIYVSVTSILNIYKKITGVTVTLNSLDITYVAGIRVVVSGHSGLHCTRAICE